MVNVKIHVSLHATVRHVSEEEEVFIYTYFLTFFLVEIAQNDFFLYLFLPSIFLFCFGFFMLIYTIGVTIS